MNLPSKSFLTAATADREATSLSMAATAPDFAAFFVSAPRRTLSPLSVTQQDQRGAEVASKAKVASGNKTRRACTGCEPPSPSRAASSAALGEPPRSLASSARAAIRRASSFDSLTPPLHFAGASAYRLSSASASSRLGASPSAAPSSSAAPSAGPRGGAARDAVQRQSRSCVEKVMVRSSSASPSSSASSSASGSRLNFLLLTTPVWCHDFAFRAATKRKNSRRKGQFNSGPLPTWPE
mmetsp:Transcript_8901/g.29399  ORF Transcript_8901/g.29399 Transcript_8901/m.29399 type:complete len:239 (-) Transcript_8901:1033-1749(-)